MKRIDAKSFITGFLACGIIAGAAVGVSASVATKTIDISYNDVKLCVDGITIEPKDANGNIVEPFISEGTTYLPVRAVASAFGKAVEWDGETKTVYLGYKPGSNIYSRKNPAPIGTAQTYAADFTNSYFYSKDANYVANVSVTDIVRGEEAWNLILKSNSFNDEAPEGYEYIIADVSIDLISTAKDEEKSFIYTMFNFYSSNYEEYKGPFIILDGELDQKVFAGGKASGKVASIVKKDDYAPKLVFALDESDYGVPLWFNLSK